MKVESRSEVGLVAPASRPRFPGPLRGAASHYNGPAMGLKGQAHSQCQARWRGTQRFHMGRNHPNPNPNGQHWQDVAYTAAVCFHGIVMEGRGKGVRPAAQGTNEGNNTHYAIFFMLGGSEEPNEEMLQAADTYVREHLGTSTWRDHSDFTSTACAGSVGARVSGGSLNLSGAVPAPSAPSGGDFITVGDRGDEVRKWQRALQSWNPGALPRFGADGDFGAETANWTVRFYNAVGLSASDPGNPRVGPASWKAMEDAPKGFSFRRTATIRRGSKGEAVREWQQALRSWNSGALPRFGADGDFGDETVNWTGRFMQAAGLTSSRPSSPVVGPRTRSAMESALS